MAWEQSKALLEIIFLQLESVRSFLPLQDRGEVMVQQ